MEGSGFLLTNFSNTPLIFRIKFFSIISVGLWHVPERDTNEC